MSPRTADQDVTAFVERHWSLALWVARRRAAQAGWRGDLDEVESDAFLGLWNAARAWRGAGSSAAWVRRHVETTITDGLRSRYGRVGYNGKLALTMATVSLDEPIGHRHRSCTPVTRGDITPDPHDHVGHIIARVDLARAMAGLTHHQRLAVAAYYWGDATLVEIADKLGVGESAVSQLLTRARRALHAALTAPPAPGAAPRCPPSAAPPARPIVTCRHCGATFHPARRDARYCSNAHRTAAHRARQANVQGPHLRRLRRWGPFAVAASWVRYAVGAPPVPWLAQGLPRHATGRGAPNGLVDPSRGPGEEDGVGVLAGAGGAERESCPVGGPDEVVGVGVDESVLWCPTRDGRIPDAPVTAVVCRLVPLVHLVGNLRAVG
ncbi:RNA polymerase, sigma-24 subunit, ECF subfamily [Kineococcus radiotolerans SRS30216 = ATCC BAA-149]|uniref:RNA polymerase, sigma-24 subunit, ECF subfamily n=1 Tax=Kineococcus radiotolerans (strain ATCC BAA-149 / DSM 14245 / SRS30216) TaxID=266940 RepID=A6W8P4_KINRD|nr:RNA polymerase, sigma-24 subunit, ECF subfamily [Kineococcus radiotolerans SRS30216 = ATCC BAA-149]